MNTISHTSSRSGAVLAEVIAGHADLTVTVDPGITRAEVTVTTTATTGPVADAVRRTTIRDTPRGIEVRVPETGGQGATTVTHYPGGAVTVTQVMGNVTGNVTGIQIGGRNSGGVFINGQRVGEAGSQATITIDVRLPVGSGLSADAISGAVTARGSLEHFAADTISGAVTAQAASIADVSTQSGRIEIGVLHTGGRLKTMSGRIEVSAYRGDQLEATTMSGRIAITATPEAAGPLSVRTMSGNIAVRGGDRGQLQVRPNTMSGRVNV